MTKKIRFIFSEAKSKLSRLGMTLFYFYMLLALAGIAGIVFGISSLILQFIPGSTPTPVWEIISIIVISFFMIKVFYNESVRLAFTDKIISLPKSENIEHINPIDSASNVIPFIKK